MISETKDFERVDNGWVDMENYQLDEGIYACTFIFYSGYSVENDRLFSQLLFDDVECEKKPKTKMIFNNENPRHKLESFFKIVLLKPTSFTLQTKIVREFKHQDDPYKGTMTVYIHPITTDF